MSRNVDGWCVTSRALILAVLPFGAMAQEALPTMPEVMAEVQDTEVYLLGYVGRGPQGGVRFLPPKTEGNGFSVVFNSDDDLDAAIAGCGFDGTGVMPCKMAGYGYLHWEGTNLKLVMTSIETINPPAAME